MGTRVPHDVDLEDRLIYGLSPQRFGYLVAGALSGFATWSGLGGPAWLRVGTGAALVALGGLVAWGRVEGRPLDRWLTDLARFLVANHRLQITSPRRLPPSNRPRRPERTIDITATGSGVGLTTIGMELAAALAQMGSRVVLTELGQRTIVTDRYPRGQGPPPHSARSSAGEGAGEFDYLVRLLPPGTGTTSSEIVMIGPAADPELVLPGATMSGARIHWVINRPQTPLPVRGHAEAGRLTVIPHDPELTLARRAGAVTGLTPGDSRAHHAIGELALAIHGST